MKLYVCATPYHLLISLFLIKKEKRPATIFIINNKKGLDEYFINLVPRLKQSDYIKNVRYRMRSSVLDKLFVGQLRDVVDYSFIEKVRKYEETVIFSWNPYSLFIASNYIYKCSKNVTLVEDGSKLFLYPKPSIVSLGIKKHLYRLVDTFNSDEKIKKILVQFPEKYPERLKKKLNTLPYSELLSNLSSEDITQILCVFLNESDLTEINKLRNKSVSLLLTQPFSEIGKMTESQKKAMYKDVLDDPMFCDETVVVKKHPAENSRYDFNNTIEIESKFPSELFELINIKFNIVVSMSTSGLEHIDANQKILLNEKIMES